MVRISKGKLAVCAQAEVSGASVRTGIYAAVRALNDLAVHGVEPTALTVQILLTPDAQEGESESDDRLSGIRLPGGRCAASLCAGRGDSGRCPDG